MNISYEGFNHHTKCVHHRLFCARVISQTVLILQNKRTFKRCCKNWPYEICSWKYSDFNQKIMHTSLNWPTRTSKMGGFEFIQQTKQNNQNCKSDVTVWQESLHFAWVVDDAKCIVVMRVCVCVCLSTAVTPTLLHGPGCNLGRGRGCPLVVHYKRIAHFAIRGAWWVRSKVTDPKVRHFYDDANDNCE